MECTGIADDAILILQGKGYTADPRVLQNAEIDQPVAVIGVAPADLFALPQDCQSIWMKTDTFVIRAEAAHAG